MDAAGCWKLIKRNLYSVEIVEMVGKNDSPGEETEGLTLTDSIVGTDRDEKEGQ